MNQNEPPPTNPAPKPALPTEAPPISLPKIDGYEILGELGQGETGVVWRARQLAVDREVALKLLPVEVFGSEPARQRFERDCTIAVTLQHPNLGRLFEVVREEDTYYIAAELIEGLPLDEYAQANALSAPAALELLSRVCAAVQHAHQHGLIHGNLKPANILVTNDGQPHVLDFAQDRAYWDSAAAAQAAAEEKVQAGLPVFLAPEALDGVRDQLDSRADIYSLGALLLWLLTGESSYDEASGQPRIVDSTDAELQAILRRALAADREQRYATVGELGADITRYLCDEPVSVIAASPAYLWQKTYRRHRRPILLTVSAVVLVAVLFLYSARQDRHQRDQARLDAEFARAEQQRIQQALERTRTELAQERAARLELSQLPPEPPAPPPPRPPAVAPQYQKVLGAVLEQLGQGHFDAAEGLLWGVPAEWRQWEWGRLLHLSNPDLFTYAVENDRFPALALAPDGRWFITGGQDAVRVWSLDGGRELRVLRGPSGVVRTVAMAADGRRVAGGATDGTIRVWDPATGRQLALATGMGEPQALAFNAEGGLLVAGGEELTLRLLDPRTGTEAAQAVLAGKASCVSFSPDRTLMASGHPDGRVMVWDTTRGRRLWEFRAHSGPTTAVAFTPNNKVVVSAGANLQIRFWEIVDGRDTGMLRGRGAPIETIAFDRQGSRMLTGSRDRSLTLWDMGNGTELATWRGHAGPLTDAVFLPDGRRVLTTALDGTARLWRAEASSEMVGCPDAAACARIFASLTKTQEPPPWDVQKSVAGTWVVTETATGRELAQLANSAGVTHCLVTSDGQRIVGAGPAGVAPRIWDAASGELVVTLPEFCVQDLGRGSVARRLVLRACDQQILLWDAADWSLTRADYDAQRRAALKQLLR